MEKTTMNLTPIHEEVFDLLYDSVWNSARDLLIASTNNSVRYSVDNSVWRLGTRTINDLITIPIKHSLKAKLPWN